MKKASLLAIVEQQQSSTDINYDLNQIALILGGPQKILYDYLSSTDITLNTDQLNKIEEIITSQHKIVLDPAHCEEKNNAQSITYTFNKNNTYYHSLFNHKTASRIIKIIYSKYLALFTILWTFVDLIRYLISTLPFAFHVITLFLSTSTFIYLILFILTINIKILKRSVCHFVFWFKILTTVYSTIFFFILRFIYLKHITMETRNISISTEILHQCTDILVITIFSGIDGFNLSKRFKIFFGVLISVYWTCWTILASLWITDYDDLDFKLFSTFRLSIGSIYLSSLRVLSIFVWKQTILAFIKKDRCINIRHSPYIKWV